MPYREQVSLLLRVLPIVGREAVFALKGGTAINLFVRDLPRLSVDIDLTFLPLIDRTDALTGIRDALQRIADGIKRQIRGATVNASPRLDAPKLVVSASGVVIKVEPNATLRGSVYPPGMRRTTPAVEAEFEQSISVSWCRRPICTAANWLRPSTVNIPAISLIQSCCLMQTASPTKFARPLSSILPVTHGRSRRSWIRD
jgi:hypothetical protein